MCVYLRGSWIGMPKQFLDVSEVGIVFKQMCGKGVPQCVHGHMFHDPGIGTCPLQYILNTSLRVPSTTDSLEKVFMRMILKKVLPQQYQQCIRQQCDPVLTAFTLENLDQHAF
jgi:hypothetical protein